jgi:hypothetical protein
VQRVDLVACAARAHGRGLHRDSRRPTQHEESACSTQTQHMRYAVRHTRASPIRPCTDVCTMHRSAHRETCVRCTGAHTERRVYDADAHTHTEVCTMHGCTHTEALHPSRPRAQRTTPTRRKNRRSSNAATGPRRSEPLKPHHCGPARAASGPRRSELPCARRADADAPWRPPGCLATVLRRLHAHDCCRAAPPRLLLTWQM